MPKRKRLTAIQKSQIVLEAIREDKSVALIATENNIHPTQIHKWKKQALEGFVHLFEDEHKGEGDGSVYAAKIGDTSLTKLGNLKRDHKFSAFFRNETPSYRLIISGSTVTIYEDIFSQNASYSIPSWISQ